MNWRKLRTKLIGSAWWVVGDEEYGRYGPYKTKAEADEDRRGMIKSMLSLDDPTYWVGEGTIK